MEGMGTRVVCRVGFHLRDRSCGVLQWPFMPSSLTLQRCEDVVKRALNREELLAGLELRNLDEEFPRISFSEEVYGHALPKAA